jgi:hypothetical protein
MDSKIKKELIDEIQQLDIKKEEEWVWWKICIASLHFAPIFAITNHFLVLALNWL